MGREGDARTFFVLLFLSCFLIQSAQPQPFLNSLAVLFRSRPPWPTMFPSAKYPGVFNSPTSTPAPGLLNGLNLTPQQQQQLLLQAQAASAANYEAKEKGIKPTESPAGVTQAPSPTMALSSYLHLPTATPVMPNYSQFNHNPLMTSVAVETSAFVEDNKSSSSESAPSFHKPPKTLSDLPNLVTSPSTINGNVVYPHEPATTAPNPYFGMLYDHNMKPINPVMAAAAANNNNNNNNNNGRLQTPRPPRRKKQKSAFRLSPWNPFPTQMLMNQLLHNHQNKNNNNHQAHRQHQQQQPHMHHQQAVRDHIASASKEKHVYYDPKKSERFRKQKNKMKDFRPSPQIGSWMETTVVTDQGTTHIKTEGLPPQGFHAPDNKFTTSFDASDASSGPKYESGFRPISFDQYASGFGTTATKPFYTNSHSQFYNPWSGSYNGNQRPNQTVHNLASYEIANANSKETDAARGDKNVSGQYVKSSQETVETEEAPVSQEQPDPLSFFGGNQPQPQTSDPNGLIYGSSSGSSSLKKLKASRHRYASKGKKKSFSAQPASISSTTASSEVVEEWIPPGIRIEKKSDGRHKKFPVFSNKAHASQPTKYVSTPNTDLTPKGILNLPDKCDKFKKYGFCPVTRQYPLESAERIATRCSALLSHLIAPLPKVDIQYEDSEPTNSTGTSSNGKSNSWSWQTFEGKPVCDTDEITTVPGWAKNENGDWMIILQTKLWQQKAHVSLCSPVAQPCQGPSCPKPSKSGYQHNVNSRILKDMKTGAEMIQETKCVQRFTAQRLAVFDPDNHDRCPVVRSVFLPSACVCLSKTTVTNGSLDESPQTKAAKSHQHNSAFSRQALFSSFEEESSELLADASSFNDELVTFDDDNEQQDVSLQTTPTTTPKPETTTTTTTTTAAPVYPMHSKEAVLEAQSSLSMPISKLPRVRVIRKHSFVTQKPQVPRPVFHRQTSLSNSKSNNTYVVVSERYSTSTSTSTEPTQDFVNMDAEPRSDTVDDSSDQLDKEFEEIFKNRPTIITSIKVNRH